MTLKDAETIARKGCTTNTNTAAALRFVPSPSSNHKNNHRSNHNSNSSNNTLLHKEKQRKSMKIRDYLRGQKIPLYQRDYIELLFMSSDNTSEQPQPQQDYEQNQQDEQKQNQNQNELNDEHLVAVRINNNWIIDHQFNIDNNTTTTTTTTNNNSKKIDNDNDNINNNNVNVNDNDVPTTSNRIMTTLILFKPKN